MTSNPDRAAYAGFWRRFVAYAIDYLLAIVASLVLVFVATLAGVVDEASQTWLSLTVIVGYFLYCTLLESSRLQATLGKQALGIRVTTRDGARIGFGRATARFFAKFLSAFTLFIGYLLIAVTPRRQGLHDLLAGTLVAHERMPPRVPGWIVALIATGACVPLVGVLAAIAIPAYQDYVIRAQVSEGLALAGAYRTAVESAWRDAPREFADLNSDSIGRGLATSGRYVESIELVSGMIVITYGAAANSAIAGRVLAIVPALDEREALDWACGYGAPPAGYEVVFEGHETYTDMPENYVPSRCRTPMPL